MYKLYTNHKIRENYTPRKLPAIQYTMPIVQILKYMQCNFFGHTHTHQRGQLVQSTKSGKQSIGQDIYVILGIGIGVYSLKGFH